VWGSWNGIGSGFVEDEEFDGLRDASRASPAVQLETLGLGSRWLPAIDSLVTSDDDFASLHWYEIFAEFLWGLVFVKLVIQAHGGATTNHNRLRVLPWHRRFQMCNVL
jgi:hypothetical protein